MMSFEHISKNMLILLLSSLLLFTGCVGAINTYMLQEKEIASIPRDVYTTYLYSSGAGERLRAALLRIPGSGVEIVPYSVQIVTALGSFEDAMDFMEKARLHRQIIVERVMYKGRAVGYLLTFSPPGFTTESIEVELTEREGKIYFYVKEITQRVY